MKQTRIVLALLLTLVMALGVFPMAVVAENADVIVVGRLSDSAYLEPNAPTYGVAEAVITQQVFEGLVTVDETGTEILPSLATDWTINDDGTVYTFNLKSGVTFSDGTPVKGEDWEWSLYRARDMETSAYAFIAASIDTVEADESTVKITLKEPSASFLAELCCFNMVVGSKARWEALGEEAYLLDPIGTGPYLVKEWAKEDHITLTANPYYHVEGFPLTPEIRFNVVSDDNTRLMQLQAGQIDIVADLPFTMTDIVKDDPSLTLSVFPSTQIRYLILNTTLAPFDDPIVRKALLMGIDKQQISDIVAGEYGAPVAAHVSEAEGKWHNSDLVVPAYDPEGAKALLTEAGYTLPITFTISERAGAEVYEQIAILLKSQLDKAGFSVNLEMLERAALSDMYTNLRHQATILQWVDDIVDPSGIIGFTTEYDQSNAWYTGLHDEDLEQLSIDARKQLDETKRVEMYHEIQARIYDNANTIALFRNAFAYGSSSKISGLNVSPFSVFFTKTLVKEK
ncbi:diguanylate cyclase [Clostridia bacterium]|nr:diguanylate cyclase [Clostridia bacterium]